MRLLLVGDFHMRTDPPERRREQDFAAVCLGKWSQVQAIAKKWECSAILQAGDLFDRPDPSNKLVADFIRLRQTSSIPMIGIHGQHDMAYHTQASRERSALAVLAAAGVLHLADDYPWFSTDHGFHAVADWLTIRGAAFGQEPPDGDDDSYNILIAHAMVGDKPLWPGHELTAPLDYAAKHPGFALTLLGDYHYPWDALLQDGRWLINCGCLVRKAASERELAHKPKVVLFDTAGGHPRNIYLDVAPAEVAFDLAGLGEKAVTPRRDFAELAVMLKSTGRAAVDFKHNLQAYFDAHATAPAVRNEAWAAFSKGE